MGVALFLILSTYFISATPPSLGLQQQQNDSLGVHLTLHHVHQLPSTSDLLAHDEARVRFINYRRLAPKSSKISNINTTTNTQGTTSVQATASGGGGGVGIGLKPGAAIGVANYYVKMGLGTPVAYYDMIIDTGSSLTWMQCKPCEVYCHPQAGPLYNPSASTTYKYVSCDAAPCANLEAATLNAPMCSMITNRCLYEASYGDQSYSIGYLSRDTLTLSPSAPNLPGFVYGCGEDSQGLFGRSAGLIGLARNSLSMISQLSPKYGSIFSYCLPTNGSSKAGTLSIGRSALYSSNMATPYVFTPMVTDPDNPSLYYLRWTGMTVLGKPLKGVPLAQYRNTPTIIDSGTVISRIPVTIYEALRAAFVQAMSSKYPKAPAYSILDTCYYNTPTKNVKGKDSTTKIQLGVPGASMIFQGGAELKLGPQNLLIEVEKGVSCLAFAGDEETGGLTIVGNMQQQTSRVVYDIANSKIGFAPGGCE